MQKKGIPTQQVAVEKTWANKVLRGFPERENRKKSSQKEQTVFFNKKEVHSNRNEGNETRKELERRKNKGKKRSQKQKVQ